MLSLYWNWLYILLSERERKKVVGLQQLEKISISSCILIGVTHPLSNRKSWKSLLNRVSPYHFSAFWLRSSAELAQPIITNGPYDYLIVTDFPSSLNLLLGAGSVIMQKKAHWSKWQTWCRLWLSRFVTICTSVGLLSHHYEIQLLHWRRGNSSLSQLTL